MGLNMSVLNKIVIQRNNVGVIVSVPVFGIQIRVFSKSCWMHISLADNFQILLYFFMLKYVILFQTCVPNTGIVLLHISSYNTSNVVLLGKEQQIK